MPDSVQPDRPSRLIPRSWNASRVLRCPTLTIMQSGSWLRSKPYSACSSPSSVAEVASSMNTMAGRLNSTRAKARRCCSPNDRMRDQRSEEHTSELQSLMRISYAVFCLKKKQQQDPPTPTQDTNVIPNLVQT